MRSFLAGFGKLFRLDGRLNRSEFAAGTVLMFLLTLGIGLAAERIFDLTPSGDEAFGLFEETVPNLVVMLVFYGAALALTVRRVRDIGAPVVPVVLSLAAIEVLEWFVFPALSSARLPAPLSSMTIPGTLLSLGAILWLLLWPGRDDSPETKDNAPMSRS